MAKDWAAVAAAIQARLEERDMTQAELASRAGVATETVRELRMNIRPRRRSPRTLAAVSEALGWPPDHLAAVANGVGDADGAGETDELAAIAAELTAVAGRLVDLAGRLKRFGE